MPEAHAIVLIGMPGAGKSTVGAALAELLGWGFLDTDDLIAEAVGCSFGDYIDREGIDAARQLESRVVTELPGRVRDQVLAVGGGTVLLPANRAALDTLGPVVWLRARPETLRSRVGDGEGRPLLVGDTDAALANLLAERTPVYADFADVVVDVDDLDPNDAAEEIAKAVSE